MKEKAMILFENPQNIEVFKSFITQFENTINDTHNGDTINICGINEVNKRFNYIANNYDPFATNTLFKNPFYIAINEQVCKQLILSQEEQYAMIAHEIGHIIDKSPREINNQLNREYNADQFAIGLDLTNELKSGLEKIIARGNYPEEIEGIKVRIIKLP